MDLQELVSGIPALGPNIALAAGLVVSVAVFWRWFRRSYGLAVWSMAVSPKVIGVLLVVALMVLFNTTGLARVVQGVSGQTSKTIGDSILAQVVALALAGTFAWCVRMWRREPVVIPRLVLVRLSQCRLIINVQAGTCLDATAPTNGAIVHAWTIHRGANQQWMFRATDDGSLVILSRWSGRCLDRPFAETDTPITLYDLCGKVNQRWAVVIQDDGSYVIRAQDEGRRALEVWGGEARDGGRVTQHPPNHGTEFGPNQRWWIKSV